MQRMIFLTLALLVQMGSAAMAQVNELPVIDRSDTIQLPLDFEQVDFYLITVDVGDHVWDNFGHTALRVVDRESGSDLVFNWGLFDTSGGSVRFAVDFMRGIMEYQLGVFPPGWELDRYRREQRTVWQDRINLTAEQKEILYRRLAWNLRQENIVYSYDYFDDNCTTRVRDYLNEALQGQILENRRALTQDSYRDEIRSHYASIPLISLSLDVLMNGNVDRRMTQWEQMFLPAQLRSQLQNLPSSVYENGRRLNLLDEPEVLMEFSPPGPRPYAYHLVALLLLPLLLLALNIRRVPIYSFSSQPGFTLRFPALSYRLLGLLGIMIAGASGIYGLIMSLGWAFSTHVDLHANLNLLLFWPTDLLALVIALRWLFSGSAAAMGTGKHQLISLYLSAHVLAMLVYLVIGLTGLAEQDTGSLMLYCVPVLFLFTLVAWMSGLRAVRAIRFS